MKIYQLFFVVAFLHASLGASVHKELKNEEQQVITSELTIPNSAGIVESQDDDDSDFKDKNDVQISPSIYEDESVKLKNTLLKSDSFIREKHVPVAIVSDPVDIIITKQIKPDFNKVESEELNKKEENKKEIIIPKVEDNKKDKKPNNVNTVEETKPESITKDEVNVVLERVELKDEQKPKEKEITKKPVESEKEKPIKQEIKNPEPNKGDEKIDNLEKEKATVEKVEPTEQLKQNDVVEESSGDTPTNPIASGINTIQMGLQSIGQNIISLFRPPTSDTSPPPNIFQNIQQTLQNIVRPPTSVESDTVDSSTPAPGLVQQGLQNLQQTVQQSLENLTQSFQNFINRPSSDPIDGDAPPPTSLLQQAVQSLQSGVQAGLSNLTSTIQNIIRPQTRPAFIQTGLSTFSEGVQNISSGLQNLFVGPQSSDSEASQPNFIQQSIQNLSVSLQNGVEGINQTIQYAINSTTQADPANPPGFPQGIINIRDGIQNALNRTVAQVFQNILGTTTTTNAPSTSESSTIAEKSNNYNAIQERFRQELQLLNNTLQDGIKSITGYIENMSLSTEETASTTKSTPIATEIVKPKEDKKTDEQNNKNAEENTVDQTVKKD